MKCGRRKRKVKELELESESEVDNLFPLLLAAVATSANDIVSECLRKLRVSLLSKREPLPTPILSMLPILLKSRHPGIASRSVEIVGAASLLCLQLNEQIAMDAEVVKAVIWGLHRKNKVSKAACSAVLDLCTSSLGRHRLLDFSALEALMWEGFAHVALDCWYHGQKQAEQSPIKLLSGVLNLMSVNMLHAMIELIAASDPIFRKACLVAAVSSPLANNDWLLVDQKAIFNEVIGHINKASMFLEVVKRFEAAAEKNVDPFKRMTWLKLLYEDIETIQEDDWITSLMGVESLLTLYAEHKDVAEAAFMQIKSKFCDEVLFENTMDAYKILLEKYKKGRKQYMNGMLSLHGN